MSTRLPADYVGCSDDLNSVVSAGSSMFGFIKCSEPGDVTNSFDISESSANALLGAVTESTSVIVASEVTSLSSSF